MRVIAKKMFFASCKNELFYQFLLAAEMHSVYVVFAGTCIL